MSDEANIPSKPQQKPTAAAPLPSQLSPQDTSNWDNRPLTTPNGRVVIEMDGTTDKTVIAE